MARELDISSESIRRILVEILGMKRVLAQLVRIKFFQKEYRKKIYLENTNSEPLFMQSIITATETGVYKFDMSTRQKSPERREKTSRNRKKHAKTAQKSR